MAIALRGTGSGNTGANFNALSVASTNASGLQIGDFMVASVVCRKADATDPTGPTGWTKRSSLAMGAAGNLSIWDKQADSSDVAASTYTWNWSAAGTGAVGLAAYSGVNLATPRDATPVMGTSSTSATATAPTMTTVTDGAMVLRIYGEEAGSGSGSFSQPTGYTEEYDSTSAAGSSTSATALSDGIQGSAGATGTADSTVGGVGTNSVGFTMALRPADVTPLVRTASVRGNAAAGSITGDIPTGVVADELMVAYLFWRDATITINSVPAGWQYVRGPDTAGVVNTATAVYYKIATSSDTAGSTYVWGLTGSILNSAGIARISGHDAASPLDTTAYTGEGSNVTDHPFPQVTTNGANRLLLRCAATGAGTATTTGTVPAPLMEIWDLGATSRWTFGGFDEQAASGASTTPNVTTNSTMRLSLTTVAITPADAIPDVTDIVAIMTQPFAYY